MPSQRSSNGAMWRQDMVQEYPAAQASVADTALTADTNLLPDGLGALTRDQRVPFQRSSKGTQTVVHEDPVAQASVADNVLTADRV